MGMFSWHAQDTDDPIYSTPGERRTVYLLDDKGNEYREDNYEGYGVFGGKDFYDVLARMNPELVDGDVIHEHTSVDVTRIVGIEIAYGNRPYRSPNLNHRPGATYTWAAPRNHANQGWYYADEEDGW